MYREWCITELLYISLLVPSPKSAETCSEMEILETTVFHSDVQFFSPSFCLLFFKNHILVFFITQGGNLAEGFWTWHLLDLQNAKPLEMSLLWCVLEKKYHIMLAKVISASGGSGGSGKGT